MRRSASSPQPTMRVPMPSSLRRGRQDCTTTSSSTERTAPESPGSCERACSRPCPAAAATRARGRGRTGRGRASSRHGRRAVAAGRTHRRVERHAVVEAALAAARRRARACAASAPQLEQAEQRHDHGGDPGQVRQRPDAGQVEQPQHVPGGEQDGAERRPGAACARPARPPPSTALLRRHLERGRPGRTTQRSARV